MVKMDTIYREVCTAILPLFLAQILKHNLCFHNNTIIGGHLNMLSLCPIHGAIQEGKYRKDKQRRMPQSRESSQFTLSDGICFRVS